MAILSTLGTLALGAALVVGGITLQSGDSTVEKIKNYNEKIKKEVEKKSKK